MRDCLGADDAELSRFRLGMLLLDVSWKACCAEAGLAMRTQSGPQLIVEKSLHNVGRQAIHLHRSESGRDVQLHNVRICTECLRLHAMPRNLGKPGFKKSSERLNLRGDISPSVMIPQSLGKSSLDFATSRRYKFLADAPTFAISNYVARL